jgi:xanthine dehydrogenase molybdopterin-binding subunit B
MLAISVFLAIRDALGNCGAPRVLPDLVAPATPEAVLRCLAIVRADTGIRPTPGALVEAGA